VNWIATGTLTARPVLEHLDLVAAPVAEALALLDPAVAATIGVAEIDAGVADTAAFCERYGVAMDASANCVLVKGKRGGDIRFAACMVRATTRADVNGVVRRWLDVRSASFAPMEEAVALSGMEYGGITPIGLPAAGRSSWMPRWRRRPRSSSAGAFAAASCSSRGVRCSRSRARTSSTTSLAESRSPVRAGARARMNNEHDRQRRGRP